MRQTELSLTKQERRAVERLLGRIFWPFFVACAMARKDNADDKRRAGPDLQNGS